MIRKRNYPERLKCEEIDRDAREVWWPRREGYFMLCYVFYFLRR